MKRLVIFFSLIVMLELSHADNLSESNRLFDCAENKFSELFRPSGVATFPLQQYLVRYYVETDTYVGTEGSDVYVYGDIFGGLLFVGKLNDLIQEICPVIVAVPDRVGKYLGTATSTVFNCNTQGNNRTTLSNGHIEITNIQNDQSFKGLGVFSSNVSGFFIEEKFDITGQISPTGVLTGRANSSAFVDGDPAGSGTSSFTGQINNNEIRIQFPEQQLGIDSCINSGTIISVTKQ